MYHDASIGMDLEPWRPIRGSAGLLAESDAPGTGMPKNAVMGHVHLHVGDLGRRRCLLRGSGFDEVSYSSQTAFCYHHHIAVATWPGTGIPNAPENIAEWNGYALEFPNQETIGQTADRLRPICAPVKPISEGYPICDPLGYRIRLVAKD